VTSYLRMVVADQLLPEDVVPESQCPLLGIMLRSRLGKVNIRFHKRSY
jgi:hypothetical protein